MFTIHDIVKVAALQFGDIVTDFHGIELLASCPECVGPLVLWRE